MNGLDGGIDRNVRGNESDLVGTHTHVIDYDDDGDMMNSIKAKSYNRLHALVRLIRLHALIRLITLTTAPLSLFFLALIPWTLRSNGPTIRTPILMTRM